MNSYTLTKAYRTEHDAHINERILVVIKELLDKQHIESVSQEMHRSRAWAYKWYKRYNDVGLEGLKGKPRSGKPSTVSKEVKDKIRQELSESNIGWDIKQEMDLIQKRTGVKYHKEHIRRLLHQWRFSPKVPRKGFVRTASIKEKNSFKKGYKTP